MNYKAKRPDQRVPLGEDSWWTIEWSNQSFGVHQTLERSFLGSLKMKYYSFLSNLTLCSLLICVCGTDNRNGLFWCYKHKDWKPNECSQVELAPRFFDKVYSKVLLLKPVKVRQHTALLLYISVFFTLQTSFQPFSSFFQTQLGPWFYNYYFHFIRKRK